MNVQLLRSDFGAYILQPASKRIRKALKRDSGNDSVLIQTDWAFPGVARSLGWNGKVGRERCEHRGTDGTVTCPDCGKTATEFISAAAQWLDDHCGHTFRGKGEEYFE